MAPSTTAVAAVAAASSTPYQLDQAQLQRNTRALVKKIQSGELQPTKKSSGKQNLLADSDAAETQDIRLEITTKKHMSKDKSLKPRKLFVPHPIRDVSDESLNVVLITADPADKYDAIIKDARFPASLRARLVNPVEEEDASIPHDSKRSVIGFKSIKTHYGKSFERRRALANDHAVFLADDRIVTGLSKVLGDDFYASTRTRPIPINLQGVKENDTDDQGNKRQKLSEGGPKLVRADISPESAAKTIARAIGATTFPVTAGTNASVVVGNSAMDPAHLAANIDFVINEVTSRFVTKGWRGLKSLDVKGTHTASLPIWKTDQLWDDDADVLEHEPVKAVKESKNDKRKRKRSALVEATELKTDAAEGAGDAKRAKVEAQKVKAAKKAKKEELLSETRAAVAAAAGAGAA